MIEMARRRWRLALLPFLFVLTAAGSLAFFLPGLWTARSVIVVDRQQILEALVKPTVTGDPESQLLRLSQEILSRPRLMPIIGQFNLYPSLRRSHSLDAVVERMRHDIRLGVPGENERRPGPAGGDAQTIAFTVAYSTTDPRTAMIVANRLAGLYVDENLKPRQQLTASTSEVFPTQLGEVRARLHEQEKRIADYKAKSVGELHERETNLRMLERLQQQLQLAQESSRRTNERRQLITRSLAEVDQTSGPGDAGASSPNPTPGKIAAARLSLLKQELAQMQTRYTDTYPDMIALKEEIRVLEAKVAESRAATAEAPRRGGQELRTVPQNPYIVSLLQQLDQANVEAKATSEEISTLNRQIADLGRRIENTPRRERELALIIRDYESTRQLYRSLQAKRGETEVPVDPQQRQKGERFRVIEPATMPEHPTGPNRLRLLLMGLVLALGASGLAVLIAEQVDTSYHNVDEVRASVPVPVLSTIPTIATERDRDRRARQQRLTAAAVAVGLLLVISSSCAVARNNDALVAMLTPVDALAGKR